MIFRVLGGVCGSTLGVFAALSESADQYMFATAVGVTAGFFAGCVVDVLIDRWRARWPR